MSLKDLTIKNEYRSFHKDIVKEFYTPLLREATLYQRAVGFFSSSALIQLSHGISELISNGGHIELIASPCLQQEDVEAIEKGYAQREKIIESRLVASLEAPQNYFESERLNLLATLIANERLIIKIAFTNNKEGFGIYHEKLGIIHDDSGHVVAFTGSMNETHAAFSQNYETIDVFCSWNDRDGRVSDKVAAFEALWQNHEPRVQIIDFPEVAKEKLQSYIRGPVNYEVDKEEFSLISKELEEVIGPKIPSYVKLHDYQLTAIAEWEKRSFRGIFDMATGTGKTFTGLGAIARLYESLNRKLAVVIVCPFQHLVEQWVEDIVKFNMKPIIGYSASQQRDWKRRLKEARIAFNLGVKEHFCFVTTNATYSSEYVMQQIDLLKENVVLVVDEAHNFGAEKLSKTLTEKIQYRLALSATIERHGDEEGTAKLNQYFGEKCLEYDLERAIRERKLTPYYYYPVVVTLTEPEFAMYRELSKEAFRQLKFDKRGKAILSEYAKLILIKRARVVAGAEQKVAKLGELMENYKTEKQILVYCGAARILDSTDSSRDADESDQRQIDAVSRLLGNDLGMRVSQFTSRESARERELLKKEFAEGDHLQVLIAIRCLDEGVNIPSIKLAFILASSTNPKEYIQRRGRVLRTAPGKTHAVIYDFITLPRPIEDVKNMEIEETRMDISLVKKEISRMKEFARISENPSAVDELIINLEDAYELLHEAGGEIFD